MSAIAPHRDSGLSLFRPTADSRYGLPLLDWLIYLFAIVYPFFVFAVFFTRDTLSTWVVLLLALIVVLEAVRTGRIVVHRSFLYLGALLLMYAVATVTIVLTEPRMAVLGRTPLERALAVDLRLFQVAVSFVVFVQVLAGAPRAVISRVLGIQMAVGATLALFGIAQYALFTMFGSDVLAGIRPTNEAFALRSYLMRIGGTKVFRSMSVFSEPSFFGFFLIPLAVKASVLWYRGSILVSRPVHIALLAIFGLAILSNFSFTAILSTAFLALLAVIVLGRRSPRRMVTVLVVIALFAFLLVISPAGGAIVERVANITAFRDVSTLDRLVRVYTSVTVFLEHPWIGVGPGGYAFWYPRMGGLDETVMATPLNIWLSFLTDVGVIGFVPFLLFLVSILSGARWAARRDPLTAAFFWSAVSYLILMTTLDFWFLEMVWFELAILLTLSATFAAGSRTTGDTWPQGARVA